MPSALPPDAMTTAERLDEVARLLATGLRRLRDRQRAQSQPVNQLEPQRLSSTATGHQSGHGPENTRPKRKSSR